MFQTVQQDSDSRLWPLALWIKAEEGRGSALAKRLQRSRSSVSRIANGKNPPSLKIAIGICEATGLTLAEVAAPWMKEQNIGHGGEPVTPGEAARPQSSAICGVGS
ncbi:MAG: helix-turn-helix transcriptional regulator [Henriciella sp.]|nr:helix-turn-helix transcriptional regulator [Henriciella sp.]